MSDPQTKLGQLIEPGAIRDAVHIAVAPVIAATKLYPGDHIGFVIDDGETVGRDPSVLIGIVDPFLKKPARAGERFWMFLYPNTITSLKHVWKHPAFEIEAPNLADPKTVSEAWLRKFCAESDCPGDYEEVIAAALNTRDNGGNYNDGDYILFRGSDAHGDIPPEFWNHIEIVTGHKIALNYRADRFSYSC